MGTNCPVVLKTLLFIWCLCFTLSLCCNMWAVWTVVSGMERRRIRQHFDEDVAANIPVDWTESERGTDVQPTANIARSCLRWFYCVFLHIRRDARCVHVVIALLCLSLWFSNFWRLPWSLHCNKCVSSVIWPVKIVPDMTYNVFDGMLNLAQSISLPKYFLTII